MDIIQILSDEFSLKKEYSENIVRLIDEGNTIPFIARYRKEMHGSCDDQILRSFGERLTYLRNLEERKKTALEAIREQGKLTEELEAAFSRAETLSAVEDLYRPFKQKKRTRAMAAREKGLAPLAELLLAQENKGDLTQLASTFTDAEKGAASPEEALSGASDILAEDMADSAALRELIKRKCFKTAILHSLAKTEEDSVYRLYYDFSEAVSTLPPHRILAVNRGEGEGILKVSVEINEEEALSAYRQLFIKPQGAYRDFLEEVISDSWRRLLFPSLEREIRRDLTERAQEQAIRLFGDNLKPLLMQPPIKGKRVLAVDPAYRTGCKLAVVDENGKALDTAVIYPTPPQSKTEESAEKMRRLIDKYQVNCISIGNGTASKEAEIFVAETIKPYHGAVSYMVVNEAGASVYSASPLGAEEFPDYDVSLRSAVSIARRLQDPLSELVKIDPRSIGVGQYQHDLPENRLAESLEGVVEDCVNAVGVDVNTASPSLLKYVSGVSQTLAQNIVRWREENGAFATRAQLKKVKGLGPRAFEQCAGFLRIPGGKEPLDNTGVHPESYAAAQKLLSLLAEDKRDLKNGVAGLDRAVKSVGAEKLADFCGVGVPTLLDMAQELAKPGRDIRESLPQPLLRSDLLSLEDLREGMVLTGTVRNVIDFGAFVDIGVHQDGLVHISELSDRYVRHPSEVVKVGDIVTVRVIGVNVPQKRISLSMKQ